MNILIELNDGTPGHVRITLEREPMDKADNETFLAAAIDRMCVVERTYRQSEELGTLIDASSHNEQPWTRTCEA